jgi:nitrile hydratase accessory protein
MTERVPFPAPGGDEPTFSEPWQARAFALTVSLHERGVFTWRECTDALAIRIASAHADGDPELGDTYHHHWLGALEDMLETKGIGSAIESARRRDACSTLATAHRMASQSSYAPATSASLAETGRPT